MSNLFFEVQKNFKLLSQKILKIKNYDWIISLPKESNHLIEKALLIHRKKKETLKYYQICLSNNNTNLYYYTIINKNKLTQLKNYLKKKKIKPINLLWHWIFKDPMIEKFVNNIMKQVKKKKLKLFFIIH